MKEKVVSIEIVQKIDKLPDGKYQGVWGGYEATIIIDGIKYTLRTQEGIRTIAAPCVVTVVNGVPTVDLL